MASRRVRMEDLAEQCGVSVATVSRVLSGKPGVRDDLRTAIRNTASAMGYAMSSSVAGQRAVLIASRDAMVDLARGQFTLHLIEGMRARATVLGMELDIRTATGPIDKSFDAGDAAGFILLTPEGDAEIAAAAALDKPVVLVNADDPKMRLCSVSPCNRSAAAHATEYLINLGHKRILFLSKPGRRTIERRQEGWFDRMRAEGLEVGPDLLVEVDDWLPDLAAKAIKERLARGKRDFTAILAAGDSLAFGALIGLAEAGVHTPGEVSVMGFDGLPQCELQSPPLSAVEIPMQQIGALALDLLRDELSEFNFPPRRVELACRIADRASVGPASPLP